MAQHDVFISYAHLDNEAEYEDQQGWLSVFQAAFRKRLSRELGRPADIFWDQRELRGNRAFDEVIREACDGASLMLAIVSPRYVQSESCRDELDYFSAKGSTRSGDRSRLVIVEKTPVKDLLDGAHPALRGAMADTLGYRFYDHDERGVRREFQIYDATLRPRFDRKLDELVQDVGKFLREASSLAGSKSVSPPASRNSAAPLERVFVAATSSDVRHLRDALTLELADRSVAVLAPAAWSDDVESMTRELGSAVAEASISVHVIGGAYGSQPEGSEQSLAELQFDQVQQLAAARDAKNPLVSLVWLCPQLEAKSERQKKFVEKLRGYEGWREHDELLTGSYEELADRILAKRERLSAERRARERPLSTWPPRESASGVVRKVYVISDPEDHARAEVVERALKQESLEVLSAAEITMDAQTEREREEQHQEYLQKSDAFLIYHGNSKFRWVRAQADEARKALGLRGRPALAGAVYVAQPVAGPKATYELMGIARCTEDEDEPRHNLRDFIAAISSASSGAEDGGQAE